MPPGEVKINSIVQSALVETLLHTLLVLQLSRSHWQKGLVGFLQVFNGLCFYMDMFFLNLKNDFSLYSSMLRRGNVLILC